jgi:hypothetical protein
MTTAANEIAFALIGSKAAAQIPDVICLSRPSRRRVGDSSCGAACGRRDRSRASSMSFEIVLRASVGRSGDYELAVLSLLGLASSINPAICR